MGKLLRSGGADYRGSGIPVTREGLAQEEREHREKNFLLDRELLVKESSYLFQGFEPESSEQGLAFLKDIFPEDPAEAPLTIFSARNEEDADIVARLEGLVILRDSVDGTNDLAHRIQDILKERAHQEEGMRPLLVMVPPPEVSDDSIRAWFQELFPSKD